MSVPDRWPASAMRGAPLHTSPASASCFRWRRTPGNVGRVMRGVSRRASYNNGEPSVMIRAPEEETGPRRPAEWAAVRLTEPAAPWPTRPCGVAPHPENLIQSDDHPEQEIQIREILRRDEDARNHKAQEGTNEHLRRSLVRATSPTVRTSSPGRTA